MIELEEDMENRFENDEELRKFLDEELIKEAESIEKELGLEDEQEDTVLSDKELSRSYQKLRGKLLKDGVYWFDDEERKRLYPYIIKHRSPFIGIALVVILSALCVLGTSLTSETNRNTFVNRMEFIFMGEK